MLVIAHPKICVQDGYLLLFQAYLLYQRVLPSGFTRKGPSSVIAPAPNEEQPGPAVKHRPNQDSGKKLHPTSLAYIRLPPFSHSTRGFAQDSCDSAK